MAQGAYGPRTDRAVPSRKAYESYESYNPHPNPVLFTAHVAAPTTSRNTRANILPRVFSVFGSPSTKKSNASQKNIFPQVFSVFGSFYMDKILANSIACNLSFKLEFERQCKCTLELQMFKVSNVFRTGAFDKTAGCAPAHPAE